MTNCLYGLRDPSNNVINCPVLDNVGKLVKAEDMPKFCEHCPMRIQAVGYAIHSAEPHRH